MDSPHAPTATKSLINEPDCADTSSARLQLVIDMGDRLVVIQALEADLQRVSELNLVSAEGAMEWTVATALKRALGLDKNAKLYSVEPVLDGRRVPDCCAPDSWESLGLFVERGGQYTATRRLRGGRDKVPRQIHPPADPPTHASQGQT